LKTVVFPDPAKPTNPIFKTPPRVCSGLQVYDPRRVI